MMAARAIAAISNPQDVMVISGKPQGQRAVLKVSFNLLLDKWALREDFLLSGTFLV